MFATLHHRLSILAISAFIPLAASCGGDERSASRSGNTSTGTAVVPVAYTATPPADSTPTDSGTAPAEVSYADAESAFHSGRYRDAETLFAVYTARHPDNAWGHYMLGLSSWKTGNLARAAGAFDQALTLDPRHRKSLLNSARVLLDLNRDTEALERVEQALALEPLSAEALRVLGRARQKLGRTDEAIDAYHRALAIDGRDVWAMNNLGLIYIQLGRYAEAVPPLARAVELRGHSPVFQNNLAMALERTGHFAASRAAYEAAIRADTSYGNAQTGLARVTNRNDDPGVEAIDVGTLAQEFAAQVKQWQDSAASTGTIMTRDTADTAR